MNVVLMAIIAIFCSPSALAIDNDGKKIIKSLPVSLDSFPVCSNHGCRNITVFNNFHKPWQIVSELYSKQIISSAEDEWVFIKNAISAMEQLTEPLIKGRPDKARNQFFVRNGQMDCVDESHNTRTYLKLLETHGFMHYHAIGELELRRLPHYTATIVEKQSGQVYAVDAWFHDNGVLPEIVDIERWQQGYEPNTSSLKHEISQSLIETYLSEVKTELNTIEVFYQEEH